MLDDFIKSIVESAAERAADNAIRRYIDETKPKSPKYGDRLSIAQLMDATGLARQTIYQKNCRHEIPGAVKVGQKLMFNAAEVLPWIEAGCPAINR